MAQETGKTMSVYLQSLQTDKYVSGPDEWTDQPDKARKFGGGSDALFYCYQHQLKDVQILGRFSNPKDDFTISLKQRGIE